MAGGSSMKSFWRKRWSASSPSTGTSRMRACTARISAAYRLSKASSAAGSC
jgi:hypothetical protein